MLSNSASDGCKSSEDCPRTALFCKPIAIMIESKNADLILLDTFVFLGLDVSIYTEER